MPETRTNAYLAIILVATNNKTEDPSVQYAGQGYVRVPRTYFYRPFLT